MFTFSNPSNIPERAKLKRSTGSMKSIKYKRTSTLSDAKYTIDALLLHFFFLGLLDTDRDLDTDNEIVRDSSRRVQRVLTHFSQP